MFSYLRRRNAEGEPSIVFECSRLQDEAEMMIKQFAASCWGDEKEYFIIRIERGEGQPPCLINQPANTDEGYLFVHFANMLFGPTNIHYIHPSYFDPEDNNDYMGIDELVPPANTVACHSISPRGNLVWVAMSDFEYSQKTRSVSHHHIYRGLLPMGERSGHLLESIADTSAASKLKRQNRAYVKSVKERIQFILNRQTAGLMDYAQ